MLGEIHLELADLNQEAAVLAIVRRHIGAAAADVDHGRAVAERNTRRVDVQVGTLSKAIGVLGGYVAGPQTVRDFLIHRARPFLFSTSHPPGVAAACIAAAGGSMAMRGSLAVGASTAQAMADCLVVPMSRPNLEMLP